MNNCDSKDGPLHRDMRTYFIEHEMQNTTGQLAKFYREVELSDTPMAGDDILLGENCSFRVQNRKFSDGDCIIVLQKLYMYMSAKEWAERVAWLKEIGFRPND